MPEQSRIVHLASVISYCTAILQYHSELRGDAALSFNESAPPERKWIDAMETARKGIETATLELHDLVQHPRNLAFSNPEIHAVRDFIFQFEIAKRVPESGGISYQTLSEQIGVDQSVVEAMLRLAVAHRIFNEGAGSRLYHSPASKLFLRAEDPQAQNALVNSATITKAIENFPQATGADRSAASLSASLCVQGLDQANLFRKPDGLPISPETDHWLIRGKEEEVWESILKIFDWKNRTSGTLFVDISPDGGKFAMNARRAFRHIRWIAVGPSPPLPELLRDHSSIFYHQQDFFHALPDTTVCGSGFLLRRVLCDFSDEDCHRILQSLVPIIASQARVYIIDRVLPRVGDVSNLEERQLRARAVRQIALHNGRERDMAQWRRLLVNADSVHRRFRLLPNRIRKVEGSDLTVLEVVWVG